MSITNSNENYAIDAIGESVFSKQWILNCLLNVANFINSDESLNGNEAIPSRIDQIEEELCLLWDMTSNEDVQRFLYYHKAHELFGVCLSKTNSPRLAEIFIGILGNLSHNKDIAQSISSDDNLCANILDLLSSSDVPFLVQVVRFLITIIYKQEDKWNSLLKQHSETFFQSIQLLLANGLNADLLKLLFQCVNQLLYLDDSFTSIWLRSDRTNTLIGSLCQACSQLISLIESDLSEPNDLADLPAESFEFYYNFWLIIQMLFDAEPSQLPRTFVKNLESLRELFFRFNDFSNNSSKCRSSYSAACLFFVTLDKLSSEQSENVDLKLYKQGLINNAKCKAALEYFKNVCAHNGNSPDEMNQITIKNICDFEKIIQASR